MDRIGKPYIECGMDKIACVVLTDMKDKVRPFAPITRNHELIAQNLIAFFEHEIRKGRLPRSLLPLQSGVGSVSNAVLGGLVNSKLSNLEFYSEVIQDSVFDLLDADVFSMTSGDFTRNAYLSIFSTESTAKDGKVSSVVPMVSPHDHTEHDVDVVVTEQGSADLRGLCPRERAKVIIENCAHPDYKDRLRDYYSRAVSSRAGHTPILLEEALSWHAAYLRNGRM